MDEDTEPPTRKLEDDIDGNEADEAASLSCHQANEPSLDDHSSIISRDESNPNPDPDLALQKMRISQMKKLRKEMRRLEKLDKIRYPSYIT